MCVVCMGYLSSWTYFYMNSPCTFCTHTFIWIILNKLTLFLIIKPTRCTNFSYLFLEWNSTRFGQFLCPTPGVFHCTHSNGICHCWQLVSRIRMELQLQMHQFLKFILGMKLYTFQTVSLSNVTSFSLYIQQWHIPLLCVQWKTPDIGQRNCSKHAEFHSKNK